MYMPLMYVTHSFLRGDVITQTPQLLHGREMSRVLQHHHGLQPRPGKQHARSMLLLLYLVKYIARYFVLHSYTAALVG